ncbi:VOC family protein [Alteromonas ponticola]|uniref:VOC family protein n=1 Tax=Alteromonas aquimaris TaxID=2998417 RepID=A0ABT3PAB6_9ALTE|nr:VOC family protein [Alteromonas aquimaris]MCW8109722.1 VOC family protein [Alteromonas aquimaris]
MIQGLTHITLAVSHIDTALSFYCDVLGFTGHAKWDAGAYLSANDVWLCLSLDLPAPSPDYTHIAWTVDQAEFVTFSETIIASGARIWKENKSFGDSLYFNDPDGNKLEIHSGTLAQRLASLIRAPYSGLQWL